MNKNRARTVIFLLSLAAFFGCTYVPNPGHINPNTEVLEEGSFRFRYPADWRITTEEKTSEYGGKVSVYNFRHPKVRICHVIIEWIKLPRGGRTSPFNEITSHKIKYFKELFESSGYRNFYHKVSHINFANRDAMKIILRADKSSLTREAVIHLLSYKDDYYAVTYQTFNTWGTNTTNRLEEITKSFQFVR